MNEKRSHDMVAAPPPPNFRVDLKISDQNNMPYSNKAFLQQVQEIF